MLVFCSALISGMLSAEQQDNAAKDKVWHFTVQAQTVISGPESEPFNMPSDVAVGAEGDLYVLDGVNHRVVVLDVDGKYRYVFGGQGSKPGQMFYPLGLATGPDGTVCVADSGNHRFQLFSRDGTLLQAVQLPVDGLNMPPDPTDAAFDFERHRLYIADNDNHRINVFDLETNSFEQPWGSPGLGERQFRFPFLIDTSPEGYLFVVEPINTRVQVLNPKGKFVSFLGNWGTRLGQLFRPKGVACLNDLIFVSDSYLGRIQVFDIQGNFLGVPLDLQQRPIKLTTPTGIAVDAANHRLYIVELQANRVCRLDLSLERN
jgi:DNA-binding beta-propeller fold protein YncE